MTNEKNYPRATLQEYGYKDFSKFEKPVKILKHILFFVIFLMLYLSIIVIAIQSVNSSVRTSEFLSITFDWYPNILQEEDLMTAIRNTFIVSFVATSIATVAGTFFAVGLYSLEKKKRQKIMLLNNVPMLNADIVTGFSLMLMFRLMMPLFPNIFGIFTLVMAHLFFTFPYVVLSVMPKLKETDPNLMDAALDLGIKPYKALIKVVIPAIKAGIFSGMLLALTMSIDDFVISYFNTGAGFDNLSIWIYGVIGRRNLTPSVYAFSTLLTIFTLAGLMGYTFIQHSKKGKKGELK
ncbi:MAG TPA: spermidine/putrescine ABC transporter permease [Acholeplasmataceae bacterium]|nr:spermidine/putrescine ABC transporter permease [Acholeplasmataceae bacterium]HBO68080.1 spermidine/putrescine ABC transporter permease [Acholeplasmataceae bacterium]HBS01491.1 spermidine/putrescine ABC transporter permease [Acholeplasmataceae bacterium]HCB20809.1 spermidine/putrescine ABC transporter permease [Acholeplasmataceae bacterium]